LERKGPTVFPAGNLNNEIGLPLTALRATESRGVDGQGPACDRVDRGLEVPFYVSVLVRFTGICW
ncbi:hypothetical protein, partial [Streptomyces sp. NPDC005093]